MASKENKGIPYIFPIDYPIAPFQEAIGYDPYVNSLGLMRDAIEKTELKEEDLY